MHMIIPTVVILKPFPHDWFEAAPARERIVLLTGHHRLGRYVVTGAYPVKNLAPDPDIDFAIGRKSVIKVERHGTVIGCVHSHPAQFGPEPSDNDLRGLPAEWIGGVWQDRSIHWYVSGQTYGTDVLVDLAAV